MTTWQTEATAFDNAATFAKRENLAKSNTWRIALCSTETIRLGDMVIDAAWNNIFMYDSTFRSSISAENSRRGDT